MNNLLLRVYLFTISILFLAITPKELKAGDPPDKEDSVFNYQWIHLDPEDDMVAGIGLFKAYQLLKNKPSRTVKVAIIDSGFDLDHEDLKSKYWTNEDEIPDNGIDDDKNGFVDDIHGWNFIGGDSANVIYDTYELTREYLRLRDKYAGKDDGKGKEYDYWLKIKDEYESMSLEAALAYAKYKSLVNSIPRYYELLKKYLDTDTLTFEQVSTINSEDSVINDATLLISKLLSYFGGSASVDQMVGIMGKGLEHYAYEVEYGYNLNFNPRNVVNDDYSNKKERYYGNNRVWDHSGMMGGHGTHVAGIIAAIRDNDLGAVGILDNVEIIPIRTVPNGDERDKDVASAIYYAVNNGASVINMSFGKSYSSDRDIVEKAIRYAEKKDVLIVHAAGNDAENKDEKLNYPTRKFIKGSKEAGNMIEVAASDRYLDENLPARFTNYGKETVDLFAPGVDVYSTMPGNTYKFSNGTSMASPVVAGVAALLRSYFPELKAEEIRTILMESSYKFEGDVYVPGARITVPFEDLTISGGIVNAYEAVKIAMNRMNLETR